MIKRILLLAVAVVFISNTSAQENYDALKDLVDAHFGTYSRLIAGELPDRFEFEVPEGITVLGSIVEGESPIVEDGVPLPPSYYNSQYYQIYLRTEFDYADLNQIIDGIFVEDLGFQSLSLHQDYPVYEPSPTPVWGFVGHDSEDGGIDSFDVYEQDYLSKQYCNAEYNAYVDENYNDYATYVNSEEKTITISISSTYSASECEEEVAYMQATIEEVFVPDYYDDFDSGVERIPALQLLPPKGSLSLDHENIPYYPTPSTRISGIKITSGWSSRAILGTPIMGEDLRIHYDKQLKDQGWTRTRGEVSGPLAWSEWAITGDDGTEWGGLLQIMSDPNWQKGVAMPIFFLLERP